MQTQSYYRESTSRSPTDVPSPHHPQAVTLRPPPPFRGIAESEREGTRAETRIGLSAKRTSPFKSEGGSVQ